MWARFEGDSSFHFVPGLRAKQYRCGLRVRRHVATAETPPSWAPVCAQCEQDVQTPQDATPPDPEISKRRLIAPGSAEEPVYFEFVKEQVVFEKSAVEQELARLNRLRHDNDFVGGSIRAWQIKDRRRRRDALYSLLARPYFGRIDFVEGGTEAPEVVYIGSGNLDAEEHIFVHDWRADICSLYYRHATGAARLACPAGVRTGEVRLHRTFTIAAGAFKGYQDLGGEGEGATAADEILVGLLSQHTTGRMRQIVQSIQAEQDTVIRNRAEIVAVQGPAGSGKTIIALHRAAYLLYQQRIAQPQGEVSGRGMLAFSPNRAFAGYIASVLPDLNEDQIRQIVLHQFLLDQLRRLQRRSSVKATFEIESAAEQFESALRLLGTEEYAARKRLCAFKSSRAMIELAEAFAARQEETAERLLAGIGFPSDGPGQESFFGQAEMQSIFHRSAGRRRPLAERIQSVLRAVAERIKDAERSPTIRGAAVTALKAQATRLERGLSPLLNRDPFAAYAALWSDRESLQAAAPPGVSIERIAAETRRSLARQNILGEDVAPILLLDGLLNGFPPLSGVDHAIIDEAQDYSLPTFEYLQYCLPDACKLTIVGDLRQATNPLLGLDDYASLDTVFTRAVEHVRLTTSYRSSLEISEFTAGIVPGDDAIESVRRTSMKPVLVSAGEHGSLASAVAAIVERERERGPGSIAIICKTAAESEALFRALEPSAPVTLVTDATREMPTGVYVLPIWLAKGLEFDTVVVHDASGAAYRHEEERRVLYTACSRALHALYVCCSGEPSPLLPLEQTELYTRMDLADLAVMPVNKTSQFDG